MRILKNQIRPLSNLILRGSSLALKFIFVLFIGKYSVDEANLGIYGIFNSAIGYTMYIIGLEYYVYVSRKITQEAGELEYYLKHQLFFYLFSYIILIPLAIFVLFGNGFISFSYLLLFTAILISEHLGQESFRLLSVLKEPLKANLLLLVRSLWIIASIAHYAYFEVIIIKMYFVFWSISSVLGVLLGIHLLRGFMDFNKLMRIRINLKEIKKGISISIYFFVSSLSIQTILLSGRFFLDFYFDKRIVGVYTFYSNIVNLIEVVIYNLVVMLIFPHMLENAYSNKEKFAIFVESFEKKIYLLAFASSIGVAFLMPFLLDFLEKPLATDRLLGFYILLTGSLLYNISLVYHYVLYAFNKDKDILKTALFAVAVNLILNFILVKKYELYGIAIAYLVSMGILLMGKVWAKKKMYRHEMNDVKS